MKKENCLVELDKSLINKYILKYGEKYSLDDEIVMTAFDHLDNSSTANIASKAIVLNSLYSAGLNTFKSKKEGVSIDVISMSEILFNYPLGAEIIDHSRAKSIIKKVNDQCMHKNKSKATSFVSKFIFCHNMTCGCKESDNIPMYDSYLKSLLYYYNQKYGFTIIFSQEEIADYDFFFQVHKVFLNYCNKMTEASFSARDIDKFVWIQGKELKEQGIDMTF